MPPIIEATGLAKCYRLGALEHHALGAEAEPHAAALGRFREPPVDPGGALGPAGHAADQQRQAHRAGQKAGNAHLALLLVGLLHGDVDLLVSLVNPALQQTDGTQVVSVPR